jgi:hypothetical protein
VQNSWDRRVDAKVQRSKGAKGQREGSRKGAKTQRKRRKKEEKGGKDGGKRSLLGFFVETKWVLVLIEVWWQSLKTFYVIKNLQSNLSNLSKSQESQGSQESQFMIDVPATPSFSFAPLRLRENPPFAPLYLRAFVPSRLRNGECFYGVRDLL